VLSSPGRALDVLRSNSKRGLVFTSRLTALLLGTLCYGCSAPKSTEWPGVSAGPGAPPSNNVLATPPTDDRPIVIAPERLATFVTATDQPYLSEGHQPPNYLIQVLVNPEAVQQYRNWSPYSSLPMGTWLVARHRNRLNPPNDADPPLYTMYRRSSDWLYGAIDASGRSVPVVAEVCHDCHTQARAQSVFGPQVKH
jgi:hypothetical protein